MAFSVLLIVLIVYNIVCRFTNLLYILDQDFTDGKVYKLLGYILKGVGYW